MNASEIGSGDWWKVVSSMPPEEALIHLNNYRSSVIEQNATRINDPAIGGMLTRVNAEIKRQNRKIDNSRWYEACRQVLTPSQFEMVCIRKRMLEGEKR